MLWSFMFLSLTTRSNIDLLSTYGFLVKEQQLLYFVFSSGMVIFHFFSFLHEKRQ